MDPIHVQLTAHALAALLLAGPDAPVVGVAYEAGTWSAEFLSGEASGVEVVPMDADDVELITELGNLRRGEVKIILFTPDDRNPSEMGEGDVE